MAVRAGTRRTPPPPPMPKHIPDTKLQFAASLIANATFTNDGATLLCARPFVMKRKIMEVLAAVKGDKRVMGKLAAAGISLDMLLNLYAKLAESTMEESSKMSAHARMAQAQLVIHTPTLDDIDDPDWVPPLVLPAPAAPARAPAARGPLHVPVGPLLSGGPQRFSHTNFVPPRTVAAAARNQHVKTLAARALREHLAATGAAG